MAFAMMLRIVFLALISTALLPFSSQTPVQGGGGVKYEKEMGIARRQFNWLGLGFSTLTSTLTPLATELTALTSVQWGKREEYKTDALQPLSAVTSAASSSSTPILGRRGAEPFLPISGFSSQPSSTTSGMNYRRQYTGSSWT